MVDLINKFALFFKNNVQYATQAMSRVEKYCHFQFEGKESRVSNRNSFLYCLVLIVNLCMLKKTLNYAMILRMDKTLINP